MLHHNLDQLARQVRLFDGLSHREIRMVLRLSHRRTFLPGGLLVGEGYPGRRLFILLYGRVSVSRRVGQQDAEIAVLGPGATLGEMSFVDRDRRSARAIACSLTETLEVDEVVLGALPAKVVISLYRNMAAIISTRLRHSNEGDSQLKRPEWLSLLMHSAEFAWAGLLAACSKRPFMPAALKRRTHAVISRSIERTLTGRPHDISASHASGAITSTSKQPALSASSFRTLLARKTKSPLKSFLRFRGID